MSNPFAKPRGDLGKIEPHVFRWAGIVAVQGDGAFRQVLDSLPAAVYITDALGLITYYNDAAAELWGHHPALGTSPWCGSWKLFWPDGTSIPHDQCPMAVALREGSCNRGMEIVAERPDGIRLSLLPYPTPIYDAEGSLVHMVNMLVDVSERQRTAERTPDSEKHYREIFDNVRVALWEEDFSEVAAWLDHLRAEGVTDLRAYLHEDAQRLAKAIRMVRVKDVNAHAVEFFEAGQKQNLLNSIADIFLPETDAIFIEELVALWEGKRRFEGEAVVQTFKGRRVDIVFTIAFEGDRFERTLVSILDISARKAVEDAYSRQTHHLQTLNRVASSIASELDLEHIVQTATDAATELCGAKFGAFFYNVTDEGGERYRLFSLSGAPREAFERFGLPRKTAVFDPTFRGEGIVRSDDIREDPRYGKDSPHFGTPPGHPPVVSYLAVPVISRSGEVHGGLFFGHDRPGIFAAEAEELVAAIAAHTAIAIDNSHLLRAAQREANERRAAELSAFRLAAIVESSDDAILATDRNGTIASWNYGAERLFGYSGEEIIGKPISALIPADRRHEEELVLRCIRTGQRVVNLDTVRRRKDASLIDVSLVISPVNDADGTIVGASKIVRDITERRRAEDQQRLLLREMNHRIKNLFAVASSVVRISEKSAKTPEDLGSAIRERLDALGRAHELTLKHRDNDNSPAATDRSASLHALIQKIVSPYENDSNESSSRVAISGPDTIIARDLTTSFALLLHEFATNAAKYGALSLPGGRIDIECSSRNDRFILTWKERGGPTRAPNDEDGFGSVLVHSIVTRQLGGGFSREWTSDGLTIRVIAAAARLSG